MSALALVGTGALRVAQLLGLGLRRLAIALDLGPTDRPPCSWSRGLMLMAGLAVLAQLGDAATTIALLTDPARPYAIEANGYMASVIEHTGFVGFVIVKLIGAGLFVALTHYALRRGLPKTAWGLGVVALLVGVLAIIWNGLQLLAGPYLI